ncbi:hypothetical protein DAPPUDRAFT_261796 [Daphnia pulex]|uniref:Uncharacterized protein n=1 Tax=Daphnia pulex TaxID=6669 RepID=E9HLP8_DAPPU|nr:hypothetical protein DAPPUDRAFT_261796 [Daphnia pulex]|eukprot:EFX67323.1 hypothetical protein DAPPUDRAFT_261796 [Daphnia pulex]
MSSLENQQILEQLSAQVRVVQAQVSEASPKPRETTGTEPYSRRYTRSSTDGEFEPELFFKVLTVVSKNFDLISKLKPTATEVIELNAAGLREITVELSEDDSSTMSASVMPIEVPYWVSDLHHLEFVTVPGVFHPSLQRSSNFTCS